MPAIAYKTGEKVIATSLYLPICCDFYCKKYDKVVTSLKHESVFPTCKCAKDSFFFLIQGENYTAVDDPDNFAYGQDGKAIAGKDTPSVDC